jgi:hypothetical protein
MAPVRRHSSQYGRGQILLLSTNCHSIRRQSSNQLRCIKITPSASACAHQASNSPLLPHRNHQHLSQTCCQNVSREQYPSFPMELIIYPITLTQSHEPPKLTSIGTLLISSTLIYPIHHPAPDDLRIHIHPTVSRQDKQSRNVLHPRASGILLTKGARGLLSYRRFWLEERICAAARMTSMS